MTEVLDPTFFKNFLPESEIFSLANTVAHDPTLLIELEDENIERLTAMQPVDSIGLRDLEIQALLRILITSNRCVVPLMSDGLGRSEFHIAGEICRIQRVIRSIGILEEIPGIAKLFEQSGDKQPGEIWFPKNVALPCPTIDNNEAFEPRMVINRSNSVTYAPSRHQFWISHFLVQILPAYTAFALNLLKPPIKLNSGVVVNDRSPKFYRSRSQASEIVAPIPGELVSV